MSDSEKVPWQRSIVPKELVYQYSPSYKRVNDPDTTYMADFAHTGNCFGCGQKLSLGWHGRYIPCRQCAAFLEMEREAEKILLGEVDNLMVPLRDAIYSIKKRLAHNLEKTSDNMDNPNALKALRKEFGTLMRDLDEISQRIKH